MRENEIKGAPLLSEHMPVSVIERGDGFYVIETTFTDCHLNAAGSVHGGIIAAFLDCGIAGGGASSRNRGVGMYGVTVTMNISFVRAARAGDARVTARVIGGGASTKFVEAELTDGGEGPVATASATVKVIEMPSQSR